MTWVVRKELRELAPVLALAVLGMLVFGAAQVFESRALDAYLLVCAMSGTLLGGYHAWRDHRAESDVFLRHRALSPTRIRVARAMAGLAALAVAVAAPWLTILLIPGEHGHDIWAPSRGVEPQSDLAAWHALIGLCFAALPWSLARFAGTVRRAWLRPLVAVLLLTVAWLAAGSRENVPTMIVLVVGAVIASIVTVFPVREIRGVGAARLVRPVALLALVCIVCPWLETSSWVRIAARDGLATSYPSVITRPDGEIRLMRRNWIDESALRVREWHVDREPLLRDERVAWTLRENAAILLGAPTRHYPRAARLLELGLTWLPAERWWEKQSRTPLEGWDVTAASMDGMASTAEYVNGRVHLWVYEEPDREPGQGDATGPQPRALGSVGPDGWTAGAAHDAAPRFSADSFSASLNLPSLRGIEPIVIVDPEARVVVTVRWPGDDEGRRALALEAKTIPAPTGAPGRLAPVSEMPYWSMRAQLNPSHTDVLTLRVSNALLTLDFQTETWRILPLLPGETLVSNHGFAGVDGLAYAVTLPPYRDVAADLRVRMLPTDSDEIVTTDFTLTPRDSMERVAGGVLGAVTLARPPLLNAVSFATPAPQTWEELETRWFRDGIVAGGLGTIWFVLSLVVGLLCALRARHQARRRCAHAGEIQAWTVAAFLLGPIGLVWMGMLVRKSAVRVTPDGRALAMHVPADWPVPASTGREVLLTP